ncbi:MAG: ABC transporter permease [Opitutales bacterium]|nr:ABC transporter permease [Opitutales bacterium]
MTQHSPDRNLPSSPDPLAADQDQPVTPETEKMSANKGPENLSQWELIGRRFMRHKLAVFSLAMLAILYIFSFGAEIFAPYNPVERNLDFAYAPPQVPSWSFSEGLHTKALLQETDPLTFEISYRNNPEGVAPLGFFVRGEPYRVLGLESDWRIFGVNHRALARQGLYDPDAEGTVREQTGMSFHFLGADKYGRDIFSRILFGGRVSLSVGLLAIFISLILGVIIGGISGYMGGAIDNFIQRSIEIINSFPQLPLWLALAAIFPADWSVLKMYFAITVVLSLLGWTGLARVVRGKILSLREEDYAMAARFLGAGHGRILFRHLAPGFTSHVIVVLTISVPAMILGETALSFLGLGLRPPIVSWGVMLQDSMQMQVVASYPWLLLPVLPIVLTVLCFNFLGDGLRDAADPYGEK